MNRTQAVDPRHGRWIVWASLLAFLWVGTAEASAVYFTSPDGWGVSASDAATANASGVPLLLPGTVSWPAGSYIDVPSRVVQSTTFATPTTANALWTVENIRVEDTLDDLWLLFTQPYPGAEYPYSGADVGLDLIPAEGWGLLEHAGHYYPAVSLGTLEPMERVDFLLHHVVDTSLQQTAEGDFVLPQYSLGIAQNLIVVPEPALAAMTLLGIATLLGARRSRARR